MDIDPIDFFPACEQYYRLNSRRPSSMCYVICTHMLAIIFSFGICIATIYCYQIYYSSKTVQTFQKPIEDKLIENLFQNVKEINESCKVLLEWKQKIDEFLQNIPKESKLDEKIEQALNTYDSDKIGMYDYASVYAGGCVISTPDTIPYPANKTLSFFKLLDINLLSNPEAILQPTNFPGNCFAFHGSKGRIRIQLGKKTEIRSITIEHSLYTDDCNSAPKDFLVYGLDSPEDKGYLIGQFSYNITGRPYQTFVIEKKFHAVQYVELEILNNYGKSFTCIYRFRVHNCFKPTGCPQFSHTN